jgi:hypothetical protein
MAVTKKKARKILSNCPPQESFWVNNGPIIKNFSVLYRELKLMNPETFKHHVSREKNDFSKWIKDCIGDQALAIELKKTTGKKTTVTKLRTRLYMLKKVAR